MLCAVESKFVLGVLFVVAKNRRGAGNSPSLAHTVLTRSLVTHSTTETNRLKSDSSVISQAALARHYRMCSPFLRKTEELMGMTCLKRPGLKLLADLANECQSLSGRIESLFQQGLNPVHKMSIEVTQLERLIEDASELQDRLQRQAALAAQWRAYAIDLNSEFDRLLTPQGPSCWGLPYEGIRDLARRIVTQLACEPIPTVLHPQLALDLFQDQFGDSTRAKVLSIALASAQTVARVARVTWLRDDQVELVAAAALLQDCGRLATVENLDWALGRVPGVEPHLRKHPLVGSALVSNYRNAPLELVALVSQHHERIDGTGYPRHLSGRQLNEASRLLACASRLERWRVRLANQSNLLTSPEIADRPAMLRFWQEARSGWWDLEFAEKILLQREGYSACVEAVTAPLHPNKSVQPPQFAKPRRMRFQRGSALLNRLQPPHR